MNKLTAVAAIMFFVSCLTSCERNALGFTQDELCAKALRDPSALVVEMLKLNRIDREAIDLAAAKCYRVQTK